jgi:hypothetical protein
MVRWAVNTTGMKNRKSNKSFLMERRLVCSLKILIAGKNPISVQNKNPLHHCRGS